MHVACDSNCGLAFHAFIARSVPKPRCRQSTCRSAEEGFEEMPPVTHCSFSRKECRACILLERILLRLRSPENKLRGLGFENCYWKARDLVGASYELLSDHHAKPYYCTCLQPLSKNVITPLLLSRPQSASS